MAFLNVLSKLNITLPAALTETRPAQSATVAPIARNFTSDNFVKSAQTLPTARPSAAVDLTKAPNQDLSFNDMILRNPALLWNTSLTPRTEQAVKAFKLGMLGRSVRDMDLRSLTADQVRQELTKRGFNSESGVIKDVRTGLPVLNPKTGKAVPMEIWSHSDGGMVRIKPEGDPTNKFRPQSHLSVSVKYPPDASGHDFNNEAFKVDFSGNPLPKWSKDCKNPYSAETPAGKKFYDDLANRTHVNLR